MESLICMEDGSVGHVYEDAHDNGINVLVNCHA